MYPNTEMVLFVWKYPLKINLLLVVAAPSDNADFHWQYGAQSSNFMTFYYMWAFR